MNNQQPIRMGILGGMGTLATSIFFDRIARHTAAQRDQEHIDLCIVNRATIPDRTEEIRTGDRRFVEMAVADCRSMEEMGVQYIAIPCNTSHYFFDEIQPQLRQAKLIHMVRETVLEAKRRIPGLKKLGIMGTDGTVGADVYGKECRAAGIEAVYPPPELQKEVMFLIYGQVKKGLHGDEALFARIADDLRSRGCGAIVLACTELSAFQEYGPLPGDMIDAMDVLVRRFIELSGKTYQ